MKNMEVESEMYKITLYALSGSWDTPYADGSIVLGISADIKLLQKKLDGIADSKASEYLEHVVETAEEERGERHYEIVDGDGRYAKFYITEHSVGISEPLMGEISREMEKIDRTNDVKAYLEALYESESIEAWKYEYMTRKPEVMQEILQVFSKTEDCNTPFNTTMAIVVGDAMKEIVLDDEKLEYLWEEFGDVLIDDDECILDDFIGFECGTHREVVWHWFNERYSGGVAKLMFGGDGHWK